MKTGGGASPAHWASLDGRKFSANSCSAPVRQTAYDGTMSKSRTYSKHRGDMMRRTAALHAKVAGAGRYGQRTEPNAAERAELKRQIAALTQQMMAP